MMNTPKFLQALLRREGRSAGLRIAGVLFALLLAATGIVLLVLPEPPQSGPGDPADALRDESPIPATAPPPAVKVRGLDFRSEGGGELQIQTDRYWCSFTHWDDPGHWIEWKVNIPGPGYYTPAFIYATELGLVTRNLSIDGVVKRERIEFPGTGGWGLEPEQWVIKKLGTGLHLQAGRAVLRMENLPPGGGLNIARLLLVPPDTAAGEIIPEDERPDIWPRHTLRYGGSTLAFTSFLPKDIRKTHPLQVPDRKRLELTVGEPDGIERRNGPVRSGIPFPEGVLESAKQVRLLDSAGEEVPLQCEPLGFWPNGSIRWLLVNFPADAAGNSRVRYVLEYGRSVGPSAAPEQPVNVTRTEDALIITTGALRAEIGKGPGNLLHSLLIESGPQSPWRFLPQDNAFQDGFGKAFLETRRGDRFTIGAGTDRSVVVEESGPLRATVRITGRLAQGDAAGGMEYEARLHFFAGRPDVVVELAFINTGAEDVFARRFGFEFPVPPGEGAGSYVFGGFPRDHVFSGAESGAALHQVSDAHYIFRGPAVSEDEQTLAGIRAPGAIAAERGKGGIALAFENFWEQYPMEVAAEGGTLRAGYAGTSGEPAFRFDPGVSKRLRFAIRPYRTEDEALGAASASIERVEEYFRPLIASPGPEWFCDSGALGPMPPVDAERYPVFERVVALNSGLVLSQREYRGEYGMRDYGDWFDWDSDRRGQWMNLEYDLPRVLMLQYARSGERKFFNHAVAAARHLMDIDFIHPHADSPLSGAVRVHSREHTRGRVCHGHLWVRGILDYYFMTGDRRAMQVARELGNYCLRLRPGGLRGTERNLGCVLQVLMDLYNATLDGRYLLGARRLAMEACRWQDPERGIWEHRIHEPGAGRGGVPFMAGVLADALGAYYDATGDDQVADAILLGARWLLSEARVRPGMFVYKHDRDTEFGPPHADLRVLNWLVRCYEMTGEERYATEARQLYIEEMKSTLRREVPKRYPPGTDNYLAIRLGGSLWFLKRFPEADRDAALRLDHLLDSLESRLHVLTHGPGGGARRDRAVGEILRANRTGDLRHAWELARRLVAADDYDLRQALMVLARGGYGRIVRRLALEFWDGDAEFLGAVAGALYEGGAFREAAHLRSKIER